MAAVAARAHPHRQRRRDAAALQRALKVAEQFRACWRRSRRAHRSRRGPRRAATCASRRQLNERLWRCRTVPSRWTCRPGPQALAPLTLAAPRSPHAPPGWPDPHAVRTAAHSWPAQLGLRRTPSPTSSWTGRASARARATRCQPERQHPRHRRSASGRWSPGDDERTPPPCRERDHWRLACAQPGLGPLQDRRHRRAAASPPRMRRRSKRCAPGLRRRRRPRVAGAPCA